VESIAGEIAVIREGRLVAAGPPEELLRAAGGAAWETVLSSAEFERRRGSLAVSSVVRRADGVHLRLVGAEPPVEDATAVEPDLEDAYLFLMQSGRPSPAVAGVA
jgi:ABC-type multidrug transport system ATPase subunit